MSTKITRAILEGCLECRYKGRLRLTGEPGEESDYQKMITEQAVQVRTLAFTRLLARHPEGEACQGATLSAADLGRGSPIVLDATIEDEQASLRFDGLVRVEGASRLGDFYYAPVLCQAGPTIGRQTRRLLAAMGLVLGAVQGRQPMAGLVVRGPECRRTKLTLDEMAFLLPHHHYETFRVPGVNFLPLWSGLLPGLSPWRASHGDRYRLTRGPAGTGPPPRASLHPAPSSRATTGPTPPTATVPGHSPSVPPKK